MEQTVSVTTQLFRNTFSDLYAVNRALKPFRRWRYVDVGLWIFLGIAPIVSNKGRATFVLGIILLVVAAIKATGIVYWLRMCFRSLKHRDHRWQYVFDDKEIELRAGDRKKCPWSDISAWRENDRVFILLIREQHCLMLPKRVFDPAQIAVFRNLLEERVVPSQT
jgi:hypothetical protein